MAEDTGYAEEIGSLKSEVHTLNTLVTTLFEKVEALFERIQPKPMGLAGYVGMAASMMAILALLFGVVIFMITSSTAPLTTQNAQITSILQKMQSDMSVLSNQNQLTNKEVAGIKNMAISNESTLEWLIFQENLPKQLTTLQERVHSLEDKAHLHPSMIKGK